MKAITNAIHHRRFGAIPGASNAWLIAELSQKYPRLVVISADRSKAEELRGNLRMFLPEWQCLHFPAWDPLPFERVSPQIQISAERCHALARLTSEQSMVMVTSIEALLQKSLEPKQLLQSATRISLASPLSHTDLVQIMESCRYQRVSLVEEVGEFAAHGAVVDFFPVHSTAPIRAEFKDGILKELRLFDQTSQRSRATLETFEILPVREFLPLPSTSVPPLDERLRNLSERREAPLREVQELRELLSKNIQFPGVELFQTIAHGPLVEIADLLPAETEILLDDPEAIAGTATRFEELAQEKDQRAQEEQRPVPMFSALFSDATATLAKLQAREPLSINTYQRFLAADESAPARVFNPLVESNFELATQLKTAIGTGNAFAPLSAYIERLRRKHFRICFVVGSAARAERLYQVLLDLNIEAQMVEFSTSQWLHAEHPFPVVITEGQLSQGFQIHSERLAFVSETEIFAERSYRKKRQAKTNIKKLLGVLSQLQEGDLVVHVDYGIGRYQGLKHLMVDGVESDLLDIQYADSRLFLPVQNISKLQKYTAAEGANPSLDKLRSQRWAKTKAKVKSAVLPLAGELIRLYASRSVSKGWRFDPQGAEDERFADLFAYEETDDQLRAIGDTLADMASERPMDRLVCGDVGFGKTEVALRAAYKCLQHQRQVAVLVPTTILAEQHYLTIRNRFQGFPLRVAGLSRFTDPKAKVEILKGLASGEVDVIVGTHRLLSKDIQFADLGLVIIDEEHRFGVKQKERLKQLRTNVDVLTLTATPIPRTLHLSLLGIRDISVISTPPHDRKVIRTYVAGFDEHLVRDAILRELQRGGQCFYLHNRVQSIGALTDRLRDLVPEARFEFSHGQMSERQLEPIMHRFLNREIDVLVSTTIIESGLDVPNANTMIVERADMFGLAQLYQIRGRVGRSSRQAYCYFLIPKSLKLGADAQARLKALQALDDLGLGFNLAMRDMEIRGAGNLLGKEQSGNVLSVGFDLYCSILQEAVQHLKGEEPLLELSLDPEVKINTPAFLPEVYIPDISERLVIYQRLASARDSSELDELRAEIEDRYGHYGTEVHELIELMRFRAFLRVAGCVRAEFASQKLLLSFVPRAALDVERILKLMRQMPNKYRLGKNHTLTITADFGVFRTNEALYQHAVEIIRGLLKTPV